MPQPKYRQFGPAWYKPSKPPRKGRNRPLERGPSGGIPPGTAGETISTVPGFQPQYGEAAPEPEAGVAGPPVDPYFEMQKAAAKRNIQLGEATDAYRIGNIESDYGFNPAGQIDYSNPYARAAQMQKRFQEAQLGTKTSYASQGQLYSGALQNAQAYNTGQRDLEENTLRKGLAREKGDILIGQAQRYGQVGAELDDETLKRLMDLLKR